MERLPTINKYVFAVGVRNLGHGAFGYAIEKPEFPEGSPVLQGQAMAVGQDGTAVMDENGDPIWEVLSYPEPRTDDDGNLVYRIPEQCIDDRGWLTMRWRWKTTMPAKYESGPWVTRTENFRPVGFIPVT